MQSKVKTVRPDVIDVEIVVGIVLMIVMIEVVSAVGTEVVVVCVIVDGVEVLRSVL